ncbi:MAG: protein kinase [Gammaproteobacteria bacterium]|jgi:serine/threonine-protein kinase
MAFTPGTQLGPYTITGPLGAGGMGEVYRATDTKLGREVAIKTLPSALANEPERLARFEREAKLLATLNHANIGAIYGLDEHAGTQFLAMELIEGETLEAKLKTGSLPVEDALRIALQIAEALEAAHEKGVIHRDLKPANVMVTSDGVVKVLDFGLAKAFSGDPNAASPAHSPALSLAMTQQGLILGTAGYMSPEQASGQATDQRADIWAFGVVLYEMLTGLPLFSGESVPHILADILRTEPDWNRLPKNLHPRLRLLLTRCLNKKVRDRYHSIADARVDIEEILRHPDIPAAAAPGEASSGQRVWPIAAALVAGLLAAGLTVWGLTRPPAPALARFDVTPETAPTVMLNSPSFAISADGQSIAYLVGGDFRGGRELRIRRLDQLESRTLLSESDDTISSPFFSPDGTQVGFYSFVVATSENILRRVSVQGGPASTIARISGNLRGASWGTDGTVVFATQDRESGLWRVRATGGEPELLTTPDTASGAVDHMWPEILPGGDAVLYTVVGESEESSKIAALSLATGEETVLLSGASSPRYSPTGHLLYGRAGTLIAVAFDPAELRIAGDAVPVQEGVLTKGNLGITEASLASNGSLLYLSGSQAATEGGRRLVWVDSAGGETPVPMPARAYQQVLLAPDEARAAFVIEGDRAVWIGDLERGTLQRLPADLGLDNPSLLFFSDDGRRIASSARREAGPAVIWQSVDGAGEPESLVTLDASIASIPWGDLAPDGRQIVLTTGGAGNLDIRTGELGDGASFRAVLATPAVEFGSVLSPDGSWLAYSSNDTGTIDVYMQRFPDGGGRIPVSVGGGIVPRWSADGSSLTYLSFTALVPQTMVRVPVTGLNRNDAPPVLGSPMELFRWRYYFVPQAMKTFDMTANGERFLMITGASQNEGNANRLILVQNWFEELNRLLPTN